MVAEPYPQEILSFQPRAAGPPERTIGWVIDWFLKNDLHLRSAEARAERARLLRLFRDFRNSDGRLMDDAPTSAVIGADLVEFLNRQPLAQWTRRRWCSTIKRPFHEAAKLGIISHSPFQAVSERRGARGRDVTWDEFRSMLRCAAPAMRRVLLFLRWSGARPEELRTLEWPHIDFLARKITKREHKTVHTTKDGAPRTIPLNGQLARLLLWVKRNHPHGGKFVFVNSFGGQWTTHALCKAVRLMREKARLPADCKLYGCRHAFITEAVLNNIDIALIAEIVGHKSILTTQTYLHLAGKAEHLQDAMERAVHFGGPAKKSTPAATVGISAEDAAKLIEVLKRVVDGK